MCAEWHTGRISITPPKKINVRSRLAITDMNESLKTKNALYHLMTYLTNVKDNNPQ